MWPLLAWVGVIQNKHFGVPHKTNYEADELIFYQGQTGDDLPFFPLLLPVFPTILFPCLSSYVMERIIKAMVY